MMFNPCFSYIISEAADWLELWFTSEREDYSNSSGLWFKRLNNQITFNLLSFSYSFLKGQDLDGMLPPSLVKLPYLNTM
jgi:hypothetical protein